MFWGQTAFTKRWKKEGNKFERITWTLYRKHHLISAQIIHIAETWSSDQSEIKNRCHWSRWLTLCRVSWTSRLYILDTEMDRWSWSHSLLWRSKIVKSINYNSTRISTGYFPKNFPQPLRSFSYGSDLSNPSRLDFVASPISFTNKIVLAY